MATLLWPIRSSPVHAMSTCLPMPGVKKAANGASGVCAVQQKWAAERPPKIKRNHHCCYEWPTDRLAVVRVVMMVVRPMLRRPDAELARVPASVPEVAADQAGVLDTGMEFGPVSTARQRTRRQNRQAGGERQPEFAHVFLHSALVPLVTLVPWGRRTGPERRIQRRFSGPPPFGRNA